MTRKTKYVAVAEEHLRDGLEQCARVFNSRADALERINRIANGFAGSNHTFALFECGKRLELRQADVEEPQPAKVTRKFV